MYEQGGQIVYQDATARKIVLGRGHSPIPVSGGKILLIRGEKRDYGDRGTCTNPKLKNWIAIYDPTTAQESIVYDKPIPNDFLDSKEACIFNQADLSPDGSTLYVVTPWAATSNMLSIVNLRTTKIAQVGGVLNVS